MSYLFASGIYALRAKDVPWRVKSEVNYDMKDSPANYGLYRAAMCDRGQGPDRKSVAVRSNRCVRCGICNCRRLQDKIRYNLEYVAACCSHKYNGARKTSYPPAVISQSLK